MDTASNTASAIVRAWKTLLVTGLLVGAGGFGGASGSLADDVGLVDGVLFVGFCWGGGLLVWLVWWLV